MGEPLIELKGVSKAFGNRVVLDRVDLTLHRGDALGIIGPSGTGKSTILRIIAGLDVPDEGEIFVQGQQRLGSIDDVPDPISIGLVFQQSALFDSLTVEENVGFYLLRHSKLPRQRIRQLVKDKLETVGLADIGDRYPAELSGGMRKRVSFARAIIANPDNPRDQPEVLLYDEPTAGLDPIASTVLEDVIRQLQCVNVGCSSYAIVTHQESTIRRAVDRLVFLYEGKIQWEGAPQEMNTTDHPMVQQFARGSTRGPIHATG
ncbi:MAG: ATP-binding cassette domain-containing protein [Lyngbya sp. HA4199-MV5]|jgi:phospholipid/cholesterol/gamma-HCH transport system ATP-binding protein|nr:ATP-binding cassette domain-containing protein [Lyngbya sp. HA4199-MV5]